MSETPLSNDGWQGLDDPLPPNFETLLAQSHRDGLIRQKRRRTALRRYGTAAGIVCLVGGFAVFARFSAGRHDSSRDNSIAKSGVSPAVSPPTESVANESTKRLEESLQKTTQDLQKAREERDRLLAGQTQYEDRIKDLASQVDGLKKEASQKAQEAVAERAKIDKAIDELQKKILDQDTLITRHNEPLGKSPQPAHTYVVTEGDTIESIARRFRMTRMRLAEYNHMSTKAALKAGDQLAIPDLPGMHAVPGGGPASPNEVIETGQPAKP